MGWSDGVSVYSRRMIIDYCADPLTWAEEHFGEADLSDQRRRRRAVTIAAAMAANPGASIPRLFTRWYDTKAAYAFFGHHEVTPDSVQLGHRDLVREQMHSPSTYLLLEDTTEVDYTGGDSIPGLGPVGNSNQFTQGAHVHTVLGVAWPEQAEASAAGRRPSLAVIGVCDQQYYIRTPRPAGEPAGVSSARKKRDRESQLWERATERLGPAPDSARWVRVCDSAADIYEQMRSCAEYGHGYVIRSAQDRTLAGEDGRTHAGRLYDRARSLEPLGHVEVALHARKGKPARTATVSVSATKVRIRSPQRPGANVGCLPPIECHVVRVWEAAAPEGVEPLEWILLVDAEVASFEAARECVLQYATRWLIEEFHMALKTGLGAERLQLETAERLFAVIAVMSVVALRLVDLRERVRCEPDAPAETAGVSAEELDVLRRINDRAITTVADVALAIGRLGGHLNRKRDGMPGWRTLWYGTTKLQLLCEGVRLADKGTSFG